MYKTIINDLCYINNCTIPCIRNERCSSVVAFCIGKMEFNQTIESGISSLLCYAPTHCESEDSCIRIARFALDKIRTERSNIDVNHYSYRRLQYENT